MSSLSSASGASLQLGIAIEIFYGAFVNRARPYPEKQTYGAVARSLRGVCGLPRCSYPPLKKPTIHRQPVICPGEPCWACSGAVLVRRCSGSGPRWPGFTPDIGVWAGHGACLLFPTWRPGRRPLAGRQDRNAPALLSRAVVSLLTQHH